MQVTTLLRAGLLLVSASHAAAHRSSHTRRTIGSASTSSSQQYRTTNYIDCANPCAPSAPADDDDKIVYYDLKASIRTMKLWNNHTYRGRTFSTAEDTTGLGYMGPTMHVKPGQTLLIKFWNQMIPTDSDREWIDHVEIEDYWQRLENAGEVIKYPYYAPKVKNSTLMKVDWPNIPKDFDSTNLHLHGLDVAVHMFDPIGTHDRYAPHVHIHPGQCYCYEFDIPDHHPAGLYWYHPHLHGSSAVQLWGGMMGLLYVDGDRLLDQLAQQLGPEVVVQSHEFVLWDPAFRRVNKATHDIEVDSFLNGQTTLSKVHPFLVNGQYTPNFEVAVDQVLHLRTLCGTIENQVTFIVYKQGDQDLHWDDAAVPFWQIASDGVTYARPRQRHILVMSGGQREELLLQFDEPGTYVISQQKIQGMQFFGMMGHPHDQILATITVQPAVGVRRANNLNDLVLTPGYEPEETIRAEDITKFDTIIFEMGTDRDKAPFPQYRINGHPFDPDRIDFTAYPGQAVEYTLINPQHNAHPFHIHVNRFQVQDMGTRLSSADYPVLPAVLDWDPTVWRDTVMVPPNGQTRIWVQYKNYTGKTVLHCHFLAHEDTGMMATLFIGRPDWHWRHDVDPWMLLCASLVGGVALLVVAVVLLVAQRAKASSLGDYQPVATMNELKSKAMD